MNFSDDDEEYSSESEDDITKKGDDDDEEIYDDDSDRDDGDSVDEDDDVDGDLDCLSVLDLNRDDEEDSDSESTESDAQRENESAEEDGGCTTSFDSEDWDSEDGDGLHNFNGGNSESEGGDSSDRDGIDDGDESNGDNEDFSIMHESEEAQGGDNRAVLDMEEVLKLMTVKALQLRLKERGKPVYGLKETLIDRLLGREERDADHVHHLDIVTHDDIRFYGLTIIGFQEERQEVRSKLLDSRFKSSFGPESRTIKDLFSALRDEFEDVVYWEILMALNFLKTCKLQVKLSLRFNDNRFTNRCATDDTEHELAGRWKRGEDWIRYHIKVNLKKLQFLKDIVIVFDGFQDGETHVAGVDGVNYGTNEFRLTPSTQFYDHKGNGCGLKYEYAVAIRRVSCVRL